MSAILKKNKQLNCGSCANLVRDKVFEAPCQNLGKIPSSKGCNSHMPDAYGLVQGKESKLAHLLDISSVMSILSANDLQVFAGLLLREKITRRSGFYFLQKVYYRIKGNASELYLNDFIVGHVLDATSEYVRIIGANGFTAIKCLNDPSSLVLYTTERFAVLRAEMKKSSTFTNPKGEHARPAAIHSDSVLPLDDLDERFLASHGVKRERDDLTKLVSQLGKGLMREPKSVRNSDAPPRSSRPTIAPDAEISIRHS